MQVKKGDFVEMEYTGKIKEGNIIFDTTNEETAKKANIWNQQTGYNAVIICVGHQQLLKGIDTALEGADVNKEKTIDIKAEDGFGKKRADLIQLVATAKFRKHGITPMPGLQVNIDDTIGMIKTVTGGRTLVDFNHPCAGKELIYVCTVKRIVTDTKEKLHAVMQQLFGKQLVDSIEIKENKAKITLRMELPTEIQEKCTTKAKELIPEITEIEYTAAAQTKVMPDINKA